MSARTIFLILLFIALLAEGRYLFYSWQQVIILNQQKVTLRNKVNQLTLAKTPERKLTNTQLALTNLLNLVRKNQIKIAALHLEAIQNHGAAIDLRLIGSYSTLMVFLQEVLFDKYHYEVNRIYFKAAKSGKLLAKIDLIILPYSFLASIKNLPTININPDPFTQFQFIFTNTK